MSLIADGHSALSAILENPEQFSKLKPADYAHAAIRLAKKQVTAGGLKLADQRALRQTLGEDVYEKTLDSLTAFQIRQLARRIDKDIPQNALKTGSSALSHVRSKLLELPAEQSSITVSSDSLLEDEAISLMDTEPVVTRNRYFGRKSFRTGR